MMFLWRQNTRRGNTVSFVSGMRLSSLVLKRESRLASWLVPCCQICAVCGDLSITLQVSKDAVQGALWVPFRTQRRLREGYGHLEQDEGRAKGWVELSMWVVVSADKRKPCSRVSRWGPSGRDHSSPLRQ